MCHFSQFFRSAGWFWSELAGLNSAVSWQPAGAGWSRTASLPHLAVSRLLAEGPQRGQTGASAPHGHLPGDQPGLKGKPIVKKLFKPQLVAQTLLGY